LGFLSWLNDLFESSEEYGTPSVTLTGQPVRSKGEKIIADYFTRHNIPYYYEAMGNGELVHFPNQDRPARLFPSAIQSVC
jgi:hypothetical protein